MSGLKFYSSKLDNSGNSIYSIYPVFGGVYLNERDLDKLYSWFGNKDIKQFIIFLEKSNLNVSRTSLKKFLENRNVCIGNECDKYLNKVNTEENKNQISLETSKTIYLPNFYIGKPAGGWNSYLSNTINKPKGPDKWYEVLYFKVLLDLFNDPTLNYSGSSLFISRDMKDNCYGDLSFSFKTENNSFDIAIGEGWSDVKALNKFLKKHAQELNNYSIIEKCGDQETKVDLDSFLKRYLTYITWEALSSPKLYLDDKNSFDKILLFLYYQYKKDNTHILIPDKADYISQIISEGIQKYLPTNYINTNWNIDNVLNYYIQYRYDNTNLQLEGLKKDIVYKLFSILDKYYKYVSKTTDININDKEKMREKMKENIISDANYIKHLIGGINGEDDTLTTYVGKNLLKNGKIDVDLFMNLIILTNIKNNLSNISSMWDRLKDELTRPQLVQGIYIYPVYYKGLNIIYNDKLLNIVKSQSDNIIIAGDAIYPIYYLIKTKLYDKWNEIPTIWKLIDKSIYQYVVPLFGKLTMLVYYILLLATLAVVLAIMLINIIKDDTREKTGLSADEIKEM